jgi:hypothetical protein
MEGENMTDPLTQIDKLAKASHLEKPPSVDVSDQVLAAIRERETAYGYAPLQWIAVGSITAAAAMSLSILSLYQKWSDPVNTLLLDLFRGLL